MREDCVVLFAKRQGNLMGIIGYLGQLHEDEVNCYGLSRWG